MKSKQEEIMKKGMVLFALLIVAYTAYAERALDEGFDYIVGETLDKQGEWSVSGGRKIEITEDSLSYENLKTSGQKASIISDVNAAPGLYKKTFHPVQIANEGDAVYFSFLMNVRNMGSDDAAVTIDLGVASIISTGNDTSTRGIYPRVKSNGPAVALTDGTHFIVGKFVRDTFDDSYGQFFLWIDPAPTSIGTTEDGMAATKTKNMYYGSADWEVSSLSIGLKGYYAAGDPNESSADLDFDEFRIGTSWAEVTPVPEKQPIKLFGLGLLLLVLLVPSKNDF